MLRASTLVAHRPATQCNAVGPQCSIKCAPVVAAALHDVGMATFTRGSLLVMQSFLRPSCRGADGRLARTPLHEGLRRCGDDQVRDFERG